MTILDEASIPKQQFCTIVDVIFIRLGILKHGGYALSLFPGSFNKQAGTAVIQKDYLESCHYKHCSLVDVLCLIIGHCIAYVYYSLYHALLNQFSVRQF